MADRSVAVRLRLITSEWTAGTAAAGASMKKLTHDMDEAARTGKKGMSELSTAAGATGTGMLLMAGMAVKAFADFDKQMSAVAAAGDEYAESLDELRASALEAGKATKFSATEAAAGQEALAKAGVSAKDIIGGGLTGALNLAASGNLSVADSAEVAASALTTFSLKGKDVSHVADLLAAGAGKAQGEVSDMAYALRQSSAVAAQMGLSIEDTVGALTMFASAGLTGSDAGTSFKQMLLSLVPNSEKASKTMDTLGLSFFDSNGEVRSFTEIAGELQSKLGGMSTAQQAATLKTLFGADAYRVAAVAMKQGAEGAAKWREAVDDSGYAAEVAAKKMDNLAGDFEQLKGSLETALISSGSGGGAPLRDLTQGVTGLVNAYLGLPGPVQQGVFWLTAASGAVLAGMGAYGALAPKIQVATDALDALGPAGQKAHGALAGTAKWAARAGGALAVLQVGNAVFGSDLEVTARGVDRLTRSLQGLAETGEVSGKAAEVLGTEFENFSYAVKTLESGNMDRFFTGFGKGMEYIGGVVGADGPIAEAEAQLRGLDSALTQLVDSGNSAAAEEAFRRMAAKAREQGISLKELEAGFPQYTEALAAAAEGAGRAAGPTDELGKKTGDLANETENAASEVKSLVDAWEELHGATLSADEAMLAAHEATKAVAESFRENGRAIKGNTVAALENRVAVQEAIKQAVDVRQKKLDEGASVKVATAAYNEHIAGLRRTLAAAGLTKAQIDQLIATYGRMPAEKQTKVSAPGAKPATDQAAALNEQIRRLRSKEARLRLVGTPEAIRQANATRRAIDAIQSRRITIEVHRTLTGVAASTRGLAEALTMKRADGGIDVVRAANGYLPKTATIMPPGDTLYAWRERETQGEAFIPLAGSKRPRSKQIAEDVVAMFGGSVAWSNGGMAVSTTTTTAPAHTPGRVVAELSPRAEAAITALAGRVVQIEMRVDSEVLARASTAGQRKINHRG